MKKLTFISALITMILCVSCSEDDLGSTNSSSNDFTIEGYIQKGPFITGTSVDVKELDSSLNSTGRSFSTQITNDFGNFKVSCTSEEEFAEFVADGYYFNEVEGELSESKLTLRAVSKMDQSTNINILTTLQVDRIKQLIQEGESYDSALTQSKSEVLALFNINETEVADFSNMNITEGGVFNSILLAISSILQCGRSVAEMSELVSKISIDLANNGIVDNTTLTDKIVESSKRVNVSEIILNLEQRYSDLGESVTIDNFYDFIDSDGDGVLNGSSPYLFVDQDSYTFEYASSEQTIYFIANYTPQIDIISDDNFIRIISVEGTKVILELTENEGQQSRVAELQFISSDGVVVDSLFIEQASSYSELSFYLNFSVSTRSTLPNSDVEVERITMVAFDSNGDLLFNNTDNTPKLNGNEYKLYFKLEDNYYENCTLYTIINGSDDYSTVSSISSMEQSKSDVTSLEVLSAKNEGVGFSSGRPSDIKSGFVVYYPDIYVALEYAGIAKIAFTINYDDSIAESDRVIRRMKLNGQIFTDTYIFKDTSEDLDMSSSVDVDTESLSSLVGGESSISGVEITLQNGNIYTRTLSSEMTLQSGAQYTFVLSISPESLTMNNTTIEGWDDPDDGTIEFSTSTTGTR